jgi:hypothetical protein
MSNVLYISPFGRKSDQSGRVIDFDRIYDEVRAGIERADSEIKLSRLDDLSLGLTIDPFKSVDSADGVVCDITTHNPNCIYELGIAHGRGKPAILVTARSGPIPFDLNRHRVIAYDPETLTEDYIEQLLGNIRRALKDPTFTVDEAAAVRGRKIFISYSHRDRDYLDRMLVHFKPLEKAGLIDPWVDTRLKAGDRWKQDIAAALQAASVAVLLVSADFLASDFIVKNELPQMLANAEKKGTRIIPVILKPCRFTRDPNLSQFQAFNTPERPLSSIPESDREQVFDALSSSLEESIPPA